MLTTPDIEGQIKRLSVNPIADASDSELQELIPFDGEISTEDQDKFVEFDQQLQDDLDVITPAGSDEESLDDSFDRGDDDENGLLFEALQGESSGKSTEQFLCTNESLGFCYKGFSASAKIASRGNQLFREDLDLKTSMDSGMAALIGKLSTNQLSASATNLGLAPAFETTEDPNLDFDFENLKKAFGGDIKSRTFPMKISSKVSSVQAETCRAPLVAPIKLARSQKFIRKRSFNCKVLPTKSLQVMNNRTKGSTKFNLQDIVGGTSSFMFGAENGRKLSSHQEPTLMSGNVPELGMGRSRRNTISVSGSSHKECHEPFMFNMTGSTMANTLESMYSSKNDTSMPSLSFSMFSNQGMLNKAGDLHCDELIDIDDTDDTDFNDRE